jgi:hypothetical protein
VPTLLPPSPSLLYFHHIFFHSCTYCVAFKKIFQQRYSKPHSMRFQGLRAIYVTQPKGWNARLAPTIRSLGGAPACKLFVMANFSYSRTFKLSLLLYILAVRFLFRFPLYPHRLPALRVSTMSARARRPIHYNRTLMATPGVRL